jgi:nucleoside-diphosphate-sugar epimerase
LGGRALVIGGRGQTGRAVAGRLLSDGWEVVATTSGALEGCPAMDGVRWLTLDPASPDGLRGSASGTDVVVHANAYTLGDAVALTDLGDAVGSAVVISTLSVYSDTEGRSLDEAEDDDSFPRWPAPIPAGQPLVTAGDATYSTRKAAVEQHLLEHARFPVTILRPGAIHGPFSRHLREWYFIKRALDRRPVVVLPYGGTSVFQPTATTNLAELAALAAGRPGRRVLDCGDEDPPSVDEIAGVVEELVGHRAEHVLVPGPPPAPNVGDHPWCTPRPVIVDMAPARDELGYRQVTGYAESVAALMPWALEATTGRDWRDVFPTLAGYPGDLFDYAAEDRFVAGNEPEST